MRVVRFIGNFFSGPSLQPMWESLSKLARHRMNYGRGGVVGESGEIFLLSYIARKFLPNGPVVVFDVGACVGEYTAHVRTVMQDRAVVYCFEPNRAAFSILSETYRGDELIHCFHLGMGDKDGEEMLYCNAKAPLFASMYRGNTYQTDSVTQQSIRIATIDSFCKSNNIDRIDLLKLDIEGHELKVLLGASDMLKARRIGFIQFEFGDCNISSRTYFKDFFDFLSPSYSIYRVLRRGLRSVRDYDESHEVFKVTNYLAVLKQ